MTTLVDFVDPKTGYRMGAPDRAVVTFPSGWTVYGQEAQRPSRLRSTSEKVRGWEMES